MIFIGNAEGTITQIINEPVYQSSSRASRVVLIAPFPNAQVTVAFRLPNGLVSDVKFATPNMEEIGFNKPLFDDSGKKLSAWTYLLERSITEFSGVVTVQFFIYENDTIRSSYTTQLTIQKGVAPILPATPETDVYESILQYLADIKGDIADIPNAVIFVDKLPDIEENIKKSVYAIKEYQGNAYYVYNFADKVWQRVDIGIKHIGTIDEVKDHDTLYYVIGKGSLAFDGSVGGGPSGPVLIQNKSDGGLRVVGEEGPVFNVVEAINVIEGKSNTNKIAISNINDSIASLDSRVTLNENGIRDNSLNIYNLKENKQDKLKAGDHIEIIDNIINTKNVATLVGGKIPADQLPSYVDDVVEGKLIDKGEFLGNDDITYNASTPDIAGKLYVDTEKNVVYRWSGTQFTAIASGDGKKIVIARAGSGFNIDDFTTGTYYNENQEIVIFTNVKVTIPVNGVDVEMFGTAMLYPYDNSIFIQKFYGSDDNGIAYEFSRKKTSTGYTDWDKVLHNSDIENVTFSDTAVAGATPLRNVKVGGIDWGISGEDDNAVSYNPQEKTEEEKAQARANIGAIDETYVENGFVPIKKVFVQSVYTVDNLGFNSTIEFIAFPKAWKIPQYDTNANIKSSTPKGEKDCANKAYVDNLYNPLKDQVDNLYGGLTNVNTDSAIAYKKDINAKALPHGRLEELGGMSYDATNLIPKVYVEQPHNDEGIIWGFSGDSVTINGQSVKAQVFLITTPMNLDTLSPGFYTLRDEQGLLQLDYKDGQGNKKSFVGQFEWKSEYELMSINIKTKPDTLYENVIVRPQLVRGTYTNETMPAFGLTGLQDSPVTEIVERGGNLWKNEFIPQLTPEKWVYGEDNGYVVYNYYNQYIPFTPQEFLQKTGLKKGDKVITQAIGYNSGESHTGSITFAKNPEDYINVFTWDGDGKLTKIFTIPENFEEYTNCQLLGNNKGGTKTVRYLMMRKWKEGDSVSSDIGYTPYTETRKPIPDSYLNTDVKTTNKKVRDYYGKGINESVYNKLDFKNKTYNFRVEEYTFTGNEEWEQISSITFLTAITKQKVVEFIGLLIGYKPSQSSGEPIDKEFSFTEVDNQTCIIISDCGYSTSESFQAHMTGKKLLFQLATPLTGDLNPLQADEINPYKVTTEAGGSLTFENEHKQAVPNTLKYEVLK